MIEYKPPIFSRETDELISIAHDQYEDWQQSAIDQAKEELKKRGVSMEYQQQVIASWNEFEKKMENDHQEKLITNKNESYSINEMVIILLMGSGILVGKWSYGLSVFELKRENYMKKLYQRIFLLIGSVFVWYLIIVITVKLVSLKDN